jgi:hypothetical protein
MSSYSNLIKPNSFSAENFYINPTYKKFGLVTIFLKLLLLKIF